MFNIFEYQQNTYTMEEIRILGIRVLDRIKEAGNLQTALSKFSPIIKTRLGFHELSKAVCSRNGFVVLELQGDRKKWDELEAELNNIRGIIVSKMSFDLSK